jgi:hypothetical protein
VSDTPTAPCSPRAPKAHPRHISSYLHMVATLFAMGSHPMKHDEDLLSGERSCVALPLTLQEPGCKLCWCWDRLLLGWSWPAALLARATRELSVRMDAFLGGFTPLYL